MHSSTNQRRHSVHRSRNAGKSDGLDWPLSEIAPRQQQQQQQQCQQQQQGSGWVV
jgi:hypothetical protein